MNRPYLPSIQFSLVVLSLLGASGLVYVAQKLTAPVPSATLASASDTASAAAADHSDWQASLATIQAQEGSSSLPAAPDPSTVDALLQSAQSSNLTETVGKTLLVSLTNAASQGLGADVPTQDQIVQGALGQIDKAASSSRTYTQNDLTIVADSPDTLKTYGNALATVFATHPNQNLQTTLIAIDAATSQSDGSKLQGLSSVESSYRALATDLNRVPVPQTLAPLQLELVNDFEQIADTYPDMEVLVTDPIRGLAAVQKYNSLCDESGRVLATIAQVFGKDGILFNKGDPGSAWAAYLALQQQQQ